MGNEVVTFTYNEVNEKLVSIEKILSLRLSIRASHRVSEMSEKFISIKSKILKQRNDRIRLIGTPEKNGVYSIPPEKAAMWNKEWDEFLAETVDVTIKKVKLSEIEEAVKLQERLPLQSDIAITPGDIANLNFLIEDDSSVEKPK